MRVEELEALKNIEISEGGKAQRTSIEDILSEYVLDKHTYCKISDILLSEMEKGLSGDPSIQAKSIVKMFPTYVRGLPDGSESGDYLALDLGGTNFRVLLVTLQGTEVTMKNKIYPISQETMHGKGTQLFDHIADCIANFMRDHNLNGKKLPLGFTFSFPCKQEGLDVGRLVRWTKGFKCEGVEGEDVVRLLHEAIKRKGFCAFSLMSVLCFFRTIFTFDCC